jgi:hypothetical protein
MNLAAGIVPYSLENGLSFLLGLEKSNKKWSGFVGGMEPKDQNIIDTAIREFNEETATVFKDHLNYIYNQIISGRAKCVTSKSPTGKEVYLYFVEFPKIVPPKLINIPRREYQEKSKLQWFSMENIKNNKNILKIFKESVINNFP